MLFGNDEGDSEGNWDGGKFVEVGLQVGLLAILDGHDDPILDGKDDGTNVGDWENVGTLVGPTILLGL